METEGTPDEFYPFFSIFGEEYAPQYIAHENPENQIAFSGDPYEEPGDVSIKTFDMRHVYRETAFVPGDSFLVGTDDWIECKFNLEVIKQDKWSGAELETWMNVAENAFFQSFANLGPGISTEEQIAWAYFFGGKRMMDAPAYSLETFFYEKTDKITTVTFGLESRCWYAGKEIPDYKKLEGYNTQSDETPIERMLSHHNIPISEYVLQSYIRDSIFRNDDNINAIVDRIAPPSSGINHWNKEYIASYILDALDEFERVYSIFTDQKTGPIRQRVSELQTAVIDFACRLQREGIDYTLLPKQTFIVLSQIQNYTAGILEDLDLEEDMTDSEIEAIENSIDDMIDIFDEIKEMLAKSRDTFRHTNLALVRDDVCVWRTLQISIGGTDVWRRTILPDSLSLSDLHRVIMRLFSWNGKFSHRFIFERYFGNDLLDENNNVKESNTLKTLASNNLNEINYEYGERWSVKIIISPHNDAKNIKPRVVAGECAPPPEHVEGPLRFRRYLSALERNDKNEKAIAEKELGKNFSPSAFNLAECNKSLEDMGL
jgi:molecular chaperone GrpE (heat shock protein)